jgi:DNA repair exonuclease SbcCD nuclease subunit
MKQERAKMSRFIFTADWHLRDKAPRCRKDEDWHGFQRELLIWIVNKVNENNCDLIIGGDIFDSPNVSAYLLNMVIRELSKINQHVYFMAGNHDLPYHAIENIDSSSIGILKNIASNHIKLVYGLGAFGEWADFGNKIQGSKTGLLFLHQLTFENSKKIPPNVKAKTAQELLDEYKDAKYIFTGDNHTSFIYTKNNRCVINPGSLYRDTSDHKNHQPVVYSVDTEKRYFEAIPVPDDGPVVDDSYIKEEEERDNRIMAFVEGIKKNGKVSLDFVKNIEIALNKNRNEIDENTLSMIHELVEGEG